jgi:virginiamycin B lyase
MLRAYAVLLFFTATSASMPSAGAPGDELPDGPGKQILQVSCTTCHDLSDVTKLRGYYTKEQWRDVVATMVEYGASLKEGEADILTEYLTATLGRK